MMKSLLSGLALSVCLSGAAAAQVCPAYPYTLNNGTTADASQVMADFNNVINCVNNNTTPNSYPLINGFVWITGRFLTIGYGTNTSNSDINLAFGSPSSNYQQLILTQSDNKFYFTTSVKIPNDLTLLGNGGISFNDAGGGARARFQQQSDNNFVLYGTDPSQNYYPVFHEYMRTSSPTLSFDVPVYIPSDERLKKNIAPISDAISVIQKLRPVRYDWRAPNERSVGQKLLLTQTERQYGFVAQELERVVPEAVRKPVAADDFYGMRPEVLIPILVQAVKEQEVKIDALEAKLAALTPH